MQYDYVVVGAGIAGCSVCHFLKDEKLLLIDRNDDVANGASGAAGAFLSPLLGKPNKFKDLVTKALNYSVGFFHENTPTSITQCGVVRLPKDDEDINKFKAYEEYFDFEYEAKEGGYFFKIGSQVVPSEVCQVLTQGIEKRFNYEVKSLEKKGEFWLINGEIETKHLILATGADTSLIEERYFNIRAVWGQKIDVLTKTEVPYNYHKACSVSVSKPRENKNLVSIGATHHRFTCDKDVCNYCIQAANINQLTSKSYDDGMVNQDTKALLEKANDIIKLDDVEVVDIKVGARSSSVDYFPMVGSLIDSKETMTAFPYLVKGTHVPSNRFNRYENLYVLNGVGGRGFVLSPYLAKNLVDSIKKQNPLEEEIVVDRLFKRWVRKQK